jgi:hypothetical protein
MWLNCWILCTEAETRCQAIITLVFWNLRRFENAKRKPKILFKAENPHLARLRVRSPSKNPYNYLNNKIINIIISEATIIIIIAKKISEEEDSFADYKSNKVQGPNPKCWKN